MSLAVELSKRLARYHQLITGALFVAALIVLAIFPSFDRRTEIEEHGLIAGYASSAFDQQWQARLHACIKGIEAQKDLPTAIDTSLREAGLEAYHLNFSSPLGQRSLTYTLAESRRADSRESLVLVIASNWTSSKAPAKFSWGVGIGVTLARYLRTVHWLSRDVFVVFLDMDLAYGASARAWLQNYLGGLSELRRGVLRQAVVLQIKNGATSLLLDVEGINGMVPNQDLVNSYSVSARDKGGLLLRHRDAWESVLHHARNGGVHSSHAPFLELQVPAFTIRGVNKKGDRGNMNLDGLTMSIEGLLRCMSNALQQLHHSFNFYFFTGPSSHISNGFYLYPVFAMQLLLISFLGTAPAYRDIRSLLVGLGSVFAISAASGSAMLVMAMGEAERSGSEGILCVRRPQLQEADRRKLAQSWLAVGGAVAACAALALRRYAFAVYSEEGAKLKGVQLPCPLWEAVRVASGFALLAVLAPVTIYSWSLAVPLTILCVPSLVMVRPMNLRKRPFRSLCLFVFLAGNAFLLFVHPTVRSSALSHLEQLPVSISRFYEMTIVPSVPRNAQKFLPWQLVQWLQQGQLAQALSSDLLVGLYEAARDYKCVGGMLFPIFCFAYWPFLMLILLIAGVLPAQRVEDDALSLSQLRLQILLVISLLMAGVAGGVLWRSYSSHGLGELQW